MKGNFFHVSQMYPFLLGKHLSKTRIFLKNVINVHFDNSFLCRKSLLDDSRVGLENLIF